MAENNIWEKEKNLENTKKVVVEFKRRISIEVRQQEEVERKDLDKVYKVKLNSNAEKFKRSELLGKYTVKIFFRWYDRKFENEYLKKLERNQQR